MKTPVFRVNSYYLITTLTDASTYSAADLAALYHQRWDVELFFRDLKTTMGMDILRCHTPAMVRKEILMHFIVYNTIRLLMLEAAKDLKVPPRKISFKASMQALRQWEPRLNKTHVTDKQRRMLIIQLRQAIASAIFADRPGRREPRCLKRRPKSFGLLTKPRHKMLEIPHRNKYRAKVA